MAKRVDPQDQYTKIKDRRKKQYWDNKEARNKAYKEWAADHKEERREYNQQWEKDHRKERNAYMRDYYKKKKEAAAKKAQEYPEQPNVTISGNPPDVQPEISN